MPSKQPKDHNRSQPRKRHLTLLPLLAIFIIVVVVSGTYLLSNKIIPASNTEQLTSQFPGNQTQLPGKDVSSDQSSQTLPAELLQDNPLNGATKQIPKQPFSKNDPAIEISPPPPLLTEIEKELQDIFIQGHKPQRESSNTANDQCIFSSQVVHDFYSHLDNQNYLSSFNIPTSSEVHFTKLIKKLLNNPPVVSRETDDLFTILQNTAHFFRIIGKNNILLLKNILEGEKGSFESVLYNFYTLTTIANCPENNFSLSIPHSVLYDYAGFFLNTMGGRLYLFRRDSISRMTVSYYAVLIIDQANRIANNKHGIQLRNVINILISEIESTDNQLKLKETYLNTLYDLKVKYQ